MEAKGTIGYSNLKRLEEPGGRAGPGQVLKNTHVNAF